MPYISEDQRRRLIDFEHYADMCPILWEMRTAGELNYQITRLLNVFMSFHDENYQMYNDMIGALECAKLELYRRKIAPYEDIKIDENGDVGYNKSIKRESKLEGWDD